MYYGNSSFSNTSSYQISEISGTGSYQAEEANYSKPTDSYSFSQPLEGQPAVDDEDSYNLIDQPTNGLYQPAYDAYTSPVSDSYNAPESVKYYP